MSKVFSLFEIYIFALFCYSGETSRGLEILNNVQAWINAVALILSSLPVSKGFLRKKITVTAQL